MCIYKKIFLLVPVLIFSGCIIPVSPSSSSAPKPAAAETKIAVAPQTQPDKKVVEIKKIVNAPEAIVPSLPALTEKKSASTPESPAIKPPSIPQKMVHHKKISHRPSPSTPEKFRRGAGLWQAFSRLSSKEQQELMKLQRKDPEKFRNIMRKKIDQLYARERARRRELQELAQKYRDSQDAAQKKALKAELRQKLDIDFKQRLQDNRRDLELNRKRLDRMETELKKREKNSNAIIDAMLERYISGKKIPAIAK